MKFVWCLKERQENENSQRCASLLSIGHFGKGVAISQVGACCGNTGCTCPGWKNRIRERGVCGGGEGGSHACLVLLASLECGNWFQVVEMEQDREAQAGARWVGLGPGLCLRVFVEPGVRVYQGQGSRVVAQNNSCFQSTAPFPREVTGIEVAA